MEDKDRHFCTLLQSLDSQEGGSALPSLSWRIFPSTGQGTENPPEKGAPPSTNNQSCQWAEVGLLQHRSPWWGCTHLHWLKIRLPRCFGCTADLCQWDIWKNTSRLSLSISKSTDVCCNSTATAWVRNRGTGVNPYCWQRQARGLAWAILTSPAAKSCLYPALPLAQQRLAGD